MANQQSPNIDELVDPDSIEVVVATEYLIQDFLVANEITFVFGAPKQFKTFLILAAVLCIAMGLDFFGRKVQQKKVLYVIAEGGDAFIGRIKAWQVLNKIPALKGNFLALKRRVNLFNDLDVRKMVKEVEALGFRPDVVVIDTLGRCMGDAEEKTKDFNKIFANLDALRRTYWPGVAEIVLSHTKKGEKVFRGPQVIAGNGDNLMYVVRRGRELRATVTCDGGGFCRNAPEFEPFGFTLVPRKVRTTKGWQDFLVVNALVEAVVGAAANESDKERRERELDELAHKVLVGRYEGPDSWTESVVWFELTKRKKGDLGLGTTTFSNCRKRLLAKRKVNMWKTAKNTFYQAVFEEGEHGELDDGPEARAPSTPESPDAPTAPSTPSTTPDAPFTMGLGVQELRSGPGSAPGSSGVVSSKSGNGHSQESAVAPVADKAAQALEYLLNKKPPNGV